jgi:hypothetical protein
MPRRPQKRTAERRRQRLQSLITIDRWSVQEIRRIAIRLAQRRINPANVIAWSVWRRAHQAIARKAHIKQNMQL